MQSGQILVGTQQGVYVIKLVGDVRLNQCTSFDDFIENMFTDHDFKDVMFDLNDAEVVDSTTLGLIAKIAMRALKNHRQKPLVLNANKSLQHLLNAMGFDALVESSNRPQSYAAKPVPLHCNAPNEQVARTMVLEAHRVLMSMNEHNADTFRNLVLTLESELAQAPVH